MPPEKERRAWLAPLLLFLAAAWCLRDVLASGGALVPGAPNTDLAAQFLAWRGYGFSELRAGRVPLWTPFLFCGMPFLGGFESALLYPPNWIHFFLPVGLAVDLTILAHLWLTGLATFAWLRARGRGAPAAFAGGVLFMFSGPVFLRLYAGHMPIICALAWVPAIFYALEKRERSLGAVAVAMQVLAGNPQYAYFTALAAAAYAGSRRAWRDLALVYGAGLAFSAAQWLPGLSAAAESVRAQASYSFSSGYALPFSSLLSLVATGRGGEFFWETSLALGVLGTALALLGLTRAREDRPLAWLALGAFLLALGPAAPLYGLAYWTLPGLSALRGVGKLAFVVSLCLSALAASGLERAASRLPEKRRVLGARLLAAVVLAESLHFAAVHRASCSSGYRYPQRWADALSKLGPDERVLHDFTRFPDAGLILRREELWGYSALVPRRTAELVAAAQGLPWRQATQYVAWRREAPKILDLLRCRVVLPEDPAAPAAPRGSPLARAQLVWSWRVASGPDAALEAVTAPDFDPRSRVILEEDPGLGAPPLVGGRPPTVDALEEEERVKLEVTVDTPRPVILLVTDSYSSGWKAKALEGSAQKAYRVLPADHALIGVPLSPGHHHLLLDYRPWTFTAGVWVSLLSAAGWLVFLVS